MKTSKKILKYSIAVLVGCFLLIAIWLRFNAVRVQWIEGNQYNTTRTEESGPFDKLVVDGPFDIHLSSVQKGVMMKGPQNLVDIVAVDNSQAKTLKISLKPGMKTMGRIQINLGVPDSLYAIDLKGASSMETDSSMVKGLENLTISAASKCSVNIHTLRLKVLISGSAVVRLGGTAEYMDLRMKGASQLDATVLEVKDMKVYMRNACQAKTRTVGTLEVSLGGASTLEYSGEPRIVGMKIRDSAKLLKI